MTWGEWGPQPPIVPPPRRGCLWLLGRMIAISTLLSTISLLGTLAVATVRTAPSPAHWARVDLSLAIYAVIAFRVVGRLRRHRGKGRGKNRNPEKVMRKLAPQRLARARDPLSAVRSEAAARGGGAYVGFSTDGTATWVGAHPEHAVLVL